MRTLTQNEIEIVSGAADIYYLYKIYGYFPNYTYVYLKYDEDYNFLGYHYTDDPTLGS